MINAGTLAFLNSSSIAMCGVVAAVAIARNREGLLVVDPSDEELKESRGIGCFAFLFSDEVGSAMHNPRRYDCIWASWKSLGGGCNEKEVFEAKELAGRKAEEIWKLIRTTIANKFVLNDEGKEDEAKRMII